MEVRFAKSIIAFAGNECEPAPLGKINDKLPPTADDLDGKDPPKGLLIRRGWKHLKEIFEVAAGFNDNHWRIPGYLDGVRLNNHRVPQPGASGIQWCGIFATYCWINGGVPGARWTMPGVGGPGVKKVMGSKGIDVGDIGVIAAGGLMHHFLVEGFRNDDRGPAAILETINGNSDYQCIKRKPTPLAQVAAYYTVEDPFTKMLMATYGQSGAGAP